MEKTTFRGAVPGLLVLLLIVIVAGLGNHFIDGLY